MTTDVVVTKRTGVRPVDDVVRVIIVAVLAAMLLSFAERTTLDERGLRIAAAAQAPLPQGGRG
jgi:hypothetical protein